MNHDGRRSDKPFHPAPSVPSSSRATLRSNHFSTRRCTESVPTDGRTQSYSSEVRLTSVVVLRGPAAVGTLAVENDVDRPGEAPPGRKRELREYRLDDLASPVRNPLWRVKAAVPPSDDCPPTCLRAPALRA